MPGDKGRRLLRNLLPGRRAGARRSARTGDDDLLAALLFRVQALESGRSLPPDVRPEQLSEEELIGFWADELNPAVGRHAARIGVSGQVCAMLTLDIAGFTRPDRDEEVRIYIRKAFYAMLREALHGSGIPWDRCYREDRGDGALVIMSPDIPARCIIDPFPERMRGLIRVYNRMSIPAAQIQVRAAAHIGPVYRDDHGLVGDDINLLCRMLDAEPLHAALADSGAELALAISGYMHDTLVRRHPALAGQTPFQQVNTQVKGTQVNAWIHLPGAPSPLQQDRAGVVGSGAAPGRRPVSGRLRHGGDGPAFVLGQAAEAVRLRLHQDYLGCRHQDRPGRVAEIAGDAGRSPR
jgi:hypothetical protein